MAQQKSIVKRAIPALIAAALGIAAPAAQAVTFSGVYVFGDSLSDAGYYRPFLRAIGVPAPLAATLGRFTTNPGPVWSEIIAQNYGGNPNPSNAGGGIYAQGGARVAVNSTSTPPGGAQRPVSTQITEYLASSGGSANANALYAVWAGGNDLLQAGAAGVASANDVAAQTARLRAVGARHILVFGLPNLGLTPGAQAGGAAGVALQTQASAGFNITMFNALAATNQRVIPVDMFSFLNEIAANAGAFGFTNVTGMACGPFPPFAPAGGNSQFCTGSNLVAPNAATTYLFADGIHPTTGAHALVADFVKSLIDGPNAYSTMAEIPLSTRASHIRTLDQGLQAGAGAAVGKVTAFAAVDGGSYDLSAGRLNPTTDSKNRTVSVGVTMRASDAVNVGLAVGSGSADANAAGVGKFDIKDTALSVFGSAKLERLYGSFSLTAADLKFNDVTRFVKLGNVTRTNKAAATGSNSSANVTVGYDFPIQKISVGPFVSITTQSVSVGGFQENAGATALSTDLKIGAQTRASRVLSLGSRASIDLGNFTPFVRFTYDQEQNNPDRFVSASPVTVAQNINYDIPGYKGVKAWGTGMIGVRGRISNQVGFALAYSSIFDRGNIKADGVTANVSLGF